MFPDLYMHGDEGLAALPLEPPSSINKILIGLWQQREELGIVADELLELFRAYGLTPPLDERERSGG
jgi:hypothetical protein